MRKARATAHAPPTFATLAAWLSPAIPVAVILLTLWRSGNGPRPRGESVFFLAATLACLVGFLGGVGGALAVRPRRDFPTLLAALLGILLNVGVGALALLLYGLSGLPGP